VLDYRALILVDLFIYCFAVTALVIAIRFFVVVTITTCGTYNYKLSLKKLKKHHKNKQTNKHCMVQAGFDYPYST